MILAIPYFPGLTDYEQLAATLKKRGQLGGHVLKVISRIEDEADAYAFGDSISSLFLKATFHGLETTERTMIQLSNDFFKAACRIVYSYAAEAGEVPNPALLYLDPTYRPSKNGWLDTLQTAFYVHREPPVMGTFENDEKLFAGPVIITKKFVEKSALVDFLPPDTQWRLYLRWELAKEAQETELIGTSAESVLKPFSPKK